MRVPFPACGRRVGGIGFEHVQTAAEYAQRKINKHANGATRQGIRQPSSQAIFGDDLLAHGYRTHGHPDHDCAQSCHPRWLYCRGDMAVGPCHRSILGNKTAVELPLSPMRRGVASPEGGKTHEVLSPVSVQVVRRHLDNKCDGSRSFLGEVPSDAPPVGGNSLGKRRRKPTKGSGFWEFPAC
jgi:hypothetical protein